jgi:hypothetical protein
MFAKNRKRRYMQEQMYSANNRYENDIHDWTQGNWFKVQLSTYWGTQTFPVVGSEERSLKFSLFNIYIIRENVVPRGGRNFGLVAII